MIVFAASRPLTAHAADLNIGGIAVTTGTDLRGGASTPHALTTGLRAAATGGTAISGDLFIKATIAIIICPIAYFFVHSGGATANPGAIFANLNASAAFGFACALESIVTVGALLVCDAVTILIYAVPTDLRAHSRGCTAPELTACAPL